MKRKNQIHWAAMSEAEIILYAKAYCQHHEIKRQRHLANGKNKHDGLYNILYKSKWMRQVFIVDETKPVRLGEDDFIIPLDGGGRVSWKSMSRQEKIDYIIAYCKEFNITNSTQLQKGPNKNPGMHSRLLDDKLMTDIFDRERLETLCGEPFLIPLCAIDKVAWEKLSEDEIIEYAKAYCKHHKIKGSGALSNHKTKRNTGMYKALMDRTLLDRVFSRPKTKSYPVNGTTYTFQIRKNRQIDWKLVTKKRLEKFGRDYCIEYGIKTRTQLKNKNAGLCNQKRRQSA